MLGRGAHAFGRLTTLSCFALDVRFAPASGTNVLGQGQEQQVLVYGSEFETPSK